MALTGGSRFCVVKMTGVLWLSAEDGARQAEAQMGRTAAELEDNIDRAAEQTQAVIGAVGERLEGAIEDAPRQTASVVQSVRSAFTSVFANGNGKIPSHGALLASESLHPARAKAHVSCVACSPLEMHQPG